MAIEKISPYIAAGGAALGLGLGIAQLAKAGRMRNIRRPVMTTPQPLLDYYRGAKFRAGTYGLPGQGQIEAKLGRQTASALRGIQQSGASSAEQIAGIAALDQASKEQVADLGVQAAQFKNQQERYADQARLAMAQQQMREFEYNQAQPFDQQRMAQAALYQGGITNLSDFAGNLSKLFSSWGEGGTGTGTGKTKQPKLENTFKQPRDYSIEQYEHEGI